MANTSDETEYLKLLEELEDNLRLSDSDDDENQNLATESIQQIGFEIVPGFRSNSKLIWISSENSFYKQNTYSKTYMESHSLATIKSAKREKY